MARFLYRFFTVRKRKLSTVILALFWVLGLFIGCCFHRSSGGISNSLMCGVASGTVSIVSLLSVTMLPFLLSALAVFMSAPFLLPVIAFLKACSMAYVSAGFASAYGSAGWLAQFLLMFSDIFTMPILWFYWLRSCETTGRLSTEKTCLMMAAVCLVGYFDFYYILPITAVI